MKALEATKEGFTEKDVKDLCEKYDMDFDVGTTVFN